MAREREPIRLRTVDDDTAEDAPVLRLSDQKMLKVDREEQPVRLGNLPGETIPLPADPEQLPNRRLDLPSKEEIELRTHQPGIEALIEQEAAPEELVEKHWGEEAARDRPVPWGWFALLGIAIAAAAVWSVKHIHDSGETVEQIRTETVTTLQDEQIEELEATRLVEAIENAVRRFFAAKSVDDLVTMVRHQERVAPMIKEFHADTPLVPARVKSIQALQPISPDNRPNFWIASVFLDDGGRRNLVVETGETGDPKIDWETLVCHQPMPWDRFVRQRPEGEFFDFRVYLEPDNFHSHEFQNSDQWTSFRLTALDSDETLFGYARAGGQAELLLTQAFSQPGAGRLSVILRLIVPARLEAPRAVVIDEVRSMRWLYLDPPE